MCPCTRLGRGCGHIRRGLAGQKLCAVVRSVRRYRAAAAATKFDTLRAEWPTVDDGQRLQKMQRLTSENIALRVFQKVRYKGAPELFCMWLCLLDPQGRTSKTKKRKRDSEGPKRHDFLAHGRHFMTPTEFLRKEHLTNVTASGYAEVSSHKYSEADTLIIPKADAVSSKVRHWLPLLLLVIHFQVYWGHHQNRQGYNSIFVCWLFDSTYSTMYFESVLDIHLQALVIFFVVISGLKELRSNGFVRSRKRRWWNDLADPCSG